MSKDHAGDGARPTGPGPRGARGGLSALELEQCILLTELRMLDRRLRILGQWDALVHGLEHLLSPRRVLAPLAWSVAALGFWRLVSGRRRRRRREAEAGDGPSSSTLASRRGSRAGPASSAAAARDLGQGPAALDALWLAAWPLLGELVPPPWRRHLSPELMRALRQAAPLLWARRPQD